MNELGADNASYYDSDMRHWNAIRKMIASAECSRGPIEVLINNTDMEHVQRLKKFQIQNRKMRWPST